jgi:hypothetical protein
MFSHMMVGANDLDKAKRFMTPRFKRWAEAWHHGSERPVDLSSQGRGVHDLPAD